jgi:hypothetical protein
MKRFLSVAAAAALVISLAAVAAAQDAKDKAAPPKDQPAATKDKDKSAKSTPKENSKDAAKDAPAAKAPAETSRDESYYPLQVGNIWHYKVGENHFALRVAKFEKVGDLNCARVEMVVEDKVTAFEHIAVTSEGVVRVAYDQRAAVPPILFLKLPPKKDQTWKVDSVVGKTDTVSGEKVSGTFKEGEMSKVGVTAGLFDSVVTCSSQDLDANGLKLSFTYYFAKGIGMIKEEIDVGGQKVVVELEKYDFGK